jgi:hypothetical protein
MEKYYENFMKEGKEKDHMEFLEYVINLDNEGSIKESRMILEKLDEETATGVAFTIEEFLTINPASSGKILDKFSTDSAKVSKLKQIIDGYSDRQKIWSLLSSASPKMFEKLKGEMGEEDSWKADVNKDLGDLGF